MDNRLKTKIVPKATDENALEKKQEQIFVLMSLLALALILIFIGAAGLVASKCGKAKPETDNKNFKR